VSQITKIAKNLCYISTGCIRDSERSEEWHVGVVFCAQEPVALSRANGEESRHVLVLNVSL